MSQIVQVMPSRTRGRMFVPYTRRTLIVGAMLLGLGGAYVLAPEPQITHEQARQEVFDAYQGYPPIDEARQVRVVGRDCGPGGKELLIRESAQYDVQWILDNCQGVDVEAVG